MKYPNPRVIEMTQLNHMLRRRGISIGWKPIRCIWEVRRAFEARIGYGSVAYFASMPVLHSKDWFEVCCYALSPMSRHGRGKEVR